MPKKVIYNGGTQGYWCCSDSSALIIGKVYELKEVYEADFYTYYVLKGVAGRFNSTWFDDLKPYFAYANVLPKVGARFSCSRVKVNDEGNLVVSNINTSMVEKVDVLEDGIYKVTTQNSVYIVQVNI